MIDPSYSTIHLKPHGKCYLEMCNIRTKDGKEKKTVWLHSADILFNKKNYYYLKNNKQF